jgi:hypothetical protein
MWLVVSDLIAGGEIGRVRQVVRGILLFAPALLLNRIPGATEQSCLRKSCSLVVTIRVAGFSWYYRGN